MRNFKSLATALMVVFTIVISGCGGSSFAPVSGTIVHEGKPVPKLRLVFSPQPVGDDFAVGPYSSGQTDSEGKFTLTTRYGDPGAVVGKHTIALKYGDIDETEMSDLRSSLMEAQDEGSREDFDKIKKKIAEVTAKLKGRPILKARYSNVFEVPPGGVEDLKIDIGDLEGSN